MRLGKTCKPTSAKRGKTCNQSVPSAGKHVTSQPKARENVKHKSKANTAWYDSIRRISSIANQNTWPLTCFFSYSWQCFEESWLFASATVWQFSLQRRQTTDGRLISSRSRLLVLALRKTEITNSAKSDKNNYCTFQYGDNLTKINHLVEKCDNLYMSSFKYINISCKLTLILWKNYCLSFAGLLLYLIKVIWTPFHKSLELSFITAEVKIFQIKIIGLKIPSGGRQAS